MDWEECLNKRIVKGVHIDEDMIKSLLKLSEKKLESESRLSLDTVTATSKFSLVYDSLRELLEALSLKKGYKIYNHECYTAFLKEIMNESELGDMFDEIRKTRNSVNYYGKDLSVEEAGDLIKSSKGLRNLVSGLLKKL